MKFCEVLEYLARGEKARRRFWTKSDPFLRYVFHKHLEKGPVLILEIGRAQWDCDAWTPSWEDLTANDWEIAAEEVQTRQSKGLAVMAASV